MGAVSRYILYGDSIAPPFLLARHRGGRSYGLSSWDTRLLRKISRRVFSERRVCLREVSAVASRLTEPQKAEIIAEYALSGNYRATARKYGVSESTVRRLCAREPEMTQKAAEKKEEIAQDMLAFMDSRKQAAQDVIDAYLAALADPEKLKKATVQQIATAFGIVVDKFTKGPASQSNEAEDLTPLAELLKPEGKEGV